MQIILNYASRGLHIMINKHELASKQANKRTHKHRQTNKEQKKERKKETNRQTHKHANKQTNKQTNKHANKKQIKQKKERHKQNTKITPTNTNETTNNHQQERLEDFVFPNVGGFGQSYVHPWRGVPAPQNGNNFGRRLKATESNVRLWVPNPVF